MQPGDAVTVVVRPEVIRLGSAAVTSSGTATPAGTGVMWTGAVRQRVFRGARNVYVVECGALSLTVEASPDQPIPSGAAITLSVDAAHTWAVRD